MVESHVIQMMQQKMRTAIKGLVQVLTGYVYIEAVPTFCLSFSPLFLGVLGTMGVLFQTMWWWRTAFYQGDCPASTEWGELLPRLSHKGAKLQ